MAIFRTEEPMPDDLCGRQLGEFVLLEKLAEGGCGTLYRCSQPLLKREAVISLRLRDISILPFWFRGDRSGKLINRTLGPFRAHAYASAWSSRIDDCTAAPRSEMLRLMWRS